MFCWNVSVLEVSSDILLIVVEGEASDRGHPKRREDHMVGRGVGTGTTRPETVSIEKVAFADSCFH